MIRPLSAALVFVLHLSILPLTAWAYGESDATGHPWMAERTLLVLTNQIRQAPHEWPGWDTTLAPGTALKPLAEHPDLFRSARFHAFDMATNDHFAHESSDGTPFSERIQRFYRGASGENIYKATNLDPYQAMTAWMNSEGHRTNILRAQWTWLGTGYSNDPTYHYYVQNFGRDGNREPETIPAATAFKLSGDRVRLIANIYDPAGREPSLVKVSMGHRCVDLKLIAGQPENGTYSSDQTAPLECEAIVFWGQTRDGNEVFRYPSTGALLTGPNCTEDFDAGHNQSNCVDGKTKQYIDAMETGCRCSPRQKPHSIAVLLLLIGLYSLVRKRQSQ